MQVTLITGLLRQRALHIVSTNEEKTVKSVIQRSSKIHTDDIATNLWGLCVIKVTPIKTKAVAQFQFSLNASLIKDHTYKVQEVTQYVKC